MPAFFSLEVTQALVVVMTVTMKSTIRFKALQSLRGFQFLSKVVKFY